MNLAEQTALMILTHLKDPKATLASVGVLYGLLIATEPSLDTWPTVNEAIQKRFAPRGEPPLRMKKLSAVKDHGWRFHDAMVEAMKAPTQTLGAKN